GISSLVSNALGGEWLYQQSRCWCGQLAVPRSPDKHGVCHSDAGTTQRALRCSHIPRPLAPPASHDKPAYVCRRRSRRHRLLHTCEPMSVDLPDPEHPCPANLISRDPTLQFLETNNDLHTLQRTAVVRI